ncbi:MAG TPA: DUF1761 domain-containing protein [Bacteroidota bacterium]|nr:DUF1761 domain-containing protein [Bacteroidota bacterium]
MERPKLNYLAILVSALVWRILGMLWYSPVLFGGTWMQITGVNDQQFAAMNPLLIYAMPIVAALITFWVLAHAVAYAKAGSAGMGALVGFWNWLGFVGAIMFVALGFQGKPVTLWCIDAGYDLVGLVIGGAILAVWKPKSAAPKAA